MQFIKQRQAVKWFEACLENNVSVVQKLISEFQGQSDNTNSQNSIDGFTGLHYACFGDAREAAALLLPYELNVKTEYEIQFEDADFNAGMNFADVCIEC